MPYYFYALLGSAVSGLFVIVAKLTSKYSIKNPWLFNFLLTIVSLLFILPAAIYYDATFPNDWIAIIFSAIFATLFNIFYIFSNYELDVSTFMPLFNFRGIFAVLIGITFFGEKLTPYKLFFVGVIIIAGIFSSMDEKFKIKSFFRFSIATGILTTLFLAVNNAFTKMALVNNSIWTTSLWIAILNVVMLIPTIYLFKKDLKKLDIAHVLPVGLMGLFGTLGGFLANLAYKSNLTVSSLIMNMPFSMIYAFLFSIFAPKLLERHTLKIYMIRFASVIIMIWATMQLTQ